MELKDAEEIANALKAELAPYCLAIEIAGAIRRHDPEVPAIELVTVPQFEIRSTGQKTLDGGDETTEHHLLFEWLDANHEILMGGVPGNNWCLLQLGGIRVDLFTAELATWGYCFMVRTGPEAFVHSIVKRLRDIGLTPLGVGLQNASMQRVPTPSEMSIFNLVGLEYLKPEERRGLD